MKKFLLSVTLSLTLVGCATVIEGEIVQSKPIRNHPGVELQEIFYEDRSYVKGGWSELWVYNGGDKEICVAEKYGQGKNLLPGKSLYIVKHNIDTKVTIENALYYKGDCSKLRG